MYTRYAHIHLGHDKERQRTGAGRSCSALHFECLSTRSPRPVLNEDYEETNTA